MLWQFLIGTQVALFYFYFKENDNHDYLGTWAFRFKILDGMVKIYDKIFGALGKTITSVMNGLVSIMKNGPLRGLGRGIFRLFFDPAWDIDKNAYGIGIFDLKANDKKEITPDEIKGLDDFEQNGFIDVLEAILTTIKFSKVGGTGIQALYHISHHTWGI